MTQEPEDHNESFEQALKILHRMEQAGVPNSNSVALAQVHATLALAREQQTTNRILRAGHPGCRCPNCEGANDG